jgi:hypothetical protein
MKHPKTRMRGIKVIPNAINLRFFVFCHGFPTSYKPQYSNPPAKTNITKLEPRDIKNRMIENRFDKSLLFIHQHIQADKSMIGAEIRKMNGKRTSL